MIKTLFAPPAAFALGLSFGEVLAAVAIGGMIGFVVFFYLTDFIFRILKKKGKQRRNNYQRAKKLIRFKKKYKIGAFLFILPFFSIPVMAFVIRKFYAHSWKIFIASLGIIVFWSICSCIVFSPIINL